MRRFLRLWILLGVFGLWVLTACESKSECPPCQEATIRSSCKNADGGLSTQDSKQESDLPDKKRRDILQSKEKAKERLPERAEPKDQPRTPSKITQCGLPRADFYLKSWDEGSIQARDLGTPLRCEALGDRSAFSLSADPSFKVSGGSAIYGMRTLRIAYRTQGPVGKARNATALLYLPIKGGKCVPKAPVVVVAHGTTGIAALCAPSHVPSLALDYMALPLVARGYFVIAPDYLGLGRASKIGHPYLVPEPTAFSILDAIRAVLRLEKDGALSSCVGSKLGVIGHSQGGHAALIMAEKIGSSHIPMNFVGAVSYAPAFGDEAIWTAPLFGIYKTTTGTAYLLSYLYAISKYKGKPSLEKWLLPDMVARVPALLQSLCFREFARFLVTTKPRLQDIFKASFLKASQLCRGGKGSCQSYQPWLGYLQEAIVGNFRSKLPLLLVQGAKDFVVSAKSVQCLEKRLKSHRNHVTTCVYPKASHASIVGSSWSNVLPWLRKAFAGEAIGELLCPSKALPSCR